MKLLIVRHAETPHNIKKILQGHSEIGLSKKGKAQAKKLTERLLKEKVDIIYCSDLIRARETIKPFLKLNKIPVVYTKHLRERNLGIFEGKKLVKFLKWIKEEGYSESSNFNFKIPGGESFQDLKKRTSEFLKTLIKKEKGKNVLLVTHGGTKVALLLSLFNKKEKTHYKKYASSNAALSIISIRDNGKHKTRLLNSIAHLQ
ncbi:MAG: histidine phosphatase family protein [Nanoarchaeota archaeon]|nr:histidine phosphatase family protein [Nanoarchaeota archaeon]MBU1103545.1 histidine phosphatase family protein [Nanoarchaeota archaeon]